LTAASFNEAKSVVVGRHQSAIANATAAFHETVAQIDADHRSFAEAYQAQWDTLKSDPDHPSHGIIREQVELSRAPADYDPARHTLAEAVIKADRDLHFELRQIASQHGVIIYTGAYPTT
jgi:hypothetical protein